MHVLCLSEPATFPLLHWYNGKMVVVTTFSKKTYKLTCGKIEQNS